MEGIFICKRLYWENMFFFWCCKNTQFGDASLFEPTVISKISMPKIPYQYFTLYEDLNNQSYTFFRNYHEICLLSMNYIKNSNDYESTLHLPSIKNNNKNPTLNFSTYSWSQNKCFQHTHTHKFRKGGIMQAL